MEARPGHPGAGLPCGAIGVHTQGPSARWDCRLGCAGPANRSPILLHRNARYPTPGAALPSMGVGAIPHLTRTGFHCDRPCPPLRSQSPATSPQVTRHVDRNRPPLESWSPSTSILVAFHFNRSRLPLGSWSPFTSIAVACHFDRSRPPLQSQSPSTSIAVAFHSDPGRLSHRSRSPSAWTEVLPHFDRSRPSRGSWSPGLRAAMAGRRRPPSAPLRVRCCTKGLRNAWIMPYGMDALHGGMDAEPGTGAICHMA